MIHKSILTTLAAACVAVSCAPRPATMKQAAEGLFLVGTALNERQITGRDTAAVRVAREHFNAIVAENCMKSESLHP